MKNKFKNISLVVVFACFLFALALSCWLKPDTLFSLSERRALMSFPSFSVDTLASGEFMDNFEEYTQDQFPLRDKFRSIKAFFSTKFLRKDVNNNLYETAGHISKIEYPENPAMLDYAAEKFTFLYENYLKGKDVNLYLSLVPDKNFFLAKPNGYLSMDYEGFINRFSEKVPFLKYIDISHLLSADDYYLTDSHWKQENIFDVASHLANVMGTSLSSDYEVNTYPAPFYGVYSGQWALPTKSDELKYLTSHELENFIVTYYDTGNPKKGEIYNMEKAAGKDPYEMFLSGSSPLLTIENPSLKNGRELVIFRDSFASSLAPLLASGYEKVTLIDIRYIQSAFVGNYVEFKDQDVLFLYSTSLINSSTALR